jgi:hypothetical protein
MKQLKSFSQRVKEQAAKKAAQETLATANPELAKLQEALNAKEKELNSFKNKVKELERSKIDLEKTKTELEQFRDLTQKEKVAQAIHSELVNTAKKLNVKESALEDVVGLLSSKFQYTPEGKVLPTLPEGSDPVETEQFVSQWLENKAHFVQPPAAQPAGIKPAAQGVKPVPTQPTGDPLSAAALNQRMGAGALFKR